MRALIMAGGTGGHVFPALAVAQELKQRGWQVDWLGSTQGMENRLVPKTGFALHTLQVQGVRGGGATRKLTAPFMLLRAVWQAMQILRALKPQVVLGFGGFASGPGGLAAFLLRRPLVIHEQNAIAGMTNRYLSRLARVVFQAFPGALAGARVVGNPVRADILALPVPAVRYAEREDALRILVLGGSLGAQALNETLPNCLAQSFSGTPVQVRHQCGRGHLAAAQAAYAATSLNASISEFIDDMSSAYGWADLLVCRAGALTVCEVAAAGVPALFVPFPAAVDDHQTHNANWLVKAGAARLLQQKDMNVVTVCAALADLHSRAALLPLAEASRRMAVTDSTQQVADVCQELAHG